MSGVKARKYVVRSKFHGVPKKEDFEIVEEELPPLQDGEVLFEAEWWTVDPYMRYFASTWLKLGDTMIGEQVARVIQSKNKDYEVGTLVIAMFGWRTHTVCVPPKEPKVLEFSKLDRSIFSDDISVSTALGILGMPGATAYFGFQRLCQPKEGETLVVTGAAGAVGSAVGQIAKLRGCRVVGFAGSDKKVEYLKGIGYDAAYNYKKMGSLADTLKEACPKGIDMFFDNVGGEFFEAVLSQMNTFGRVSVCGAISMYNATEPPKARPVSHLILSHQLKVEGFMVKRWETEWPTAFKEMKQWIKQGTLKYSEHVVEGFDNMVDAFNALFTGDNIGKVVVKK